MKWRLLFLSAPALAQNAHVRGDFLYSSMRPRVQATLDLTLYIVFFLPGICALIYALGVVAIWWAPDTGGKTLEDTK